jgi:hypothetical protein
MRAKRQCFALFLRRELMALLPGIDPVDKVATRVRKRVVRVVSAAIVFVSVAVLSASVAARSEELEPRSYSAAPIGTNFLILGFAHTGGAVSLDPTLPVSDVHGNFNVGELGYEHTFALGRNTASMSFVMPYVQGDLTGQVKEQSSEITRAGLGDFGIRFAWNVIGDPAMTPGEFARRKPTTTAGVSLSIVAPTGSYDPAHLINISSNRWAFKPEIGVEQPIDKWFVDGSVASELFTDNADFYGGKVRSQEPIWDFQAHGGYNFRPGMWLSAGATYYTGGDVSVNAISTHTVLADARYGLTFSAPLSKGFSAKLNWSNWLSGQLGAKFDVYGLAFQYRWFDH